MNITSYEQHLRNRGIVRENDSFINALISYMPHSIKEVAQVVQVKKNTEIVKKDDPVDFVYITLQGEIAVVNEFESGKVFEPVVIYPNDFMVVVEAILGMDEIITTNTAKTDVEIIKIPKKLFLYWLDKSPEITRMVLDSVCLNFKHNMKVSGEGVLLDSMYLFISHMLNNAVHDKDNQCYTLAETREKTAIRTGINLRTLYRHIKRLKEDHYISNKHQKICFDEKQKARLFKYNQELRNK